MAGTSTFETVNNWQQNKTALECNQYMLQNQVACDVTFKLQAGNEKLGAHKFVLMSRSPKFFRMLHRQTVDEIEIPEIAGEPFRQFLRYLYLDEVHLSEETCLGILKAAKEYKVNSLLDKCKEFLQKQMNEQNVWAVLECAVKIKEQDLVQICLGFIDESTEECFNSHSFKNISHTVLCKVLARDTLSIEEVDVFRACLKWAGSRCLENKVAITAEKIGKYLDRAFYLIRFPVIDVSDFTDNVKGLLSEQDIMSIYLTLKNVRPPTNVQFSSLERKGMGKTTAVYVTGVAQEACNPDGSLSLGYADMYTDKNVKIYCVYFACRSRESFKKIKQVDIICNDTGESRTSDKIKEIAPERAPDKAYIYYRAIFKNGVPVTPKYYSNIVFQYHSAPTVADIVYFSGSPEMTSNNVTFTFRYHYFHHFKGVSFVADAEI